MSIFLPRKVSDTTTDELRGLVDISNAVWYQVVFGGIHSDEVVSEFVFDSGRFKEEIQRREDEGMA